MFASLPYRWGRFVYRHRVVVLVVFLIAVACSGLFGRDLSGRMSKEGWFDESSESVAASKLADTTFGRDTDSDVVVLYTAVLMLRSAFTEKPSAPAAQANGAAIAD